MLNSTETQTLHPKSPLPQNIVCKISISNDKYVRKPEYAKNSLQEVPRCPDGQLLPPRFVSVHCMENTPFHDDMLAEQRLNSKINQ